MRKLLLISNSTNAGESYLSWPKNHIKAFLGECKNIVFIPFAGVTFSYDAYEAKVNEGLAEVGLQVKGIHHFDDMAKAIAEADAIMTGGGNTFHLVQQLQQNNLLDPIRKKVQEGTPYVGWSAGSNIACPTIKTTNDMPIVEPDSFNVLGLVPFQINPHYLDANPNGHAGETRQQRLEEFIAVNPDVYVAGLREGTLFKIEGDKIELIGDRSCRIFKKDIEFYEVEPGGDLSFLL